MSNLQETQFRDQKTYVKPPISDVVCHRRQNLEMTNHMSNLQETEFRDKKT